MTTRKSPGFTKSPSLGSIPDSPSKSSQKTAFPAQPEPELEEELLELDDDEELDELLELDEELLELEEELELDEELDELVELDEDDELELLDPEGLV